MMLFAVCDIRIMPKCQVMKLAAGNELLSNGRIIKFYIGKYCLLSCYELSNNQNNMKRTTS